MVFFRLSGSGLARLMKYGAWRESFIPWARAAAPTARAVSSLTRTPLPHWYSKASSPRSASQAGYRSERFPL